MGLRTKNWLSANLSSESRQSRLRSGPQENANNLRNQARRTSKQLHKLQTGPGRRTHRKGTKPPGKDQESTHARMGRQRPWRKTPTPGTGPYSPGLKRKRCEKGDGLVPKQSEPTVSEVDSEANPRWPTALRLVEKGKHRVEAQLRAQHQTMPTDRPWDTKNENTGSAEPCGRCRRYQRKDPDTESVENR